MQSRVLGAFRYRDAIVAVVIAGFATFVALRYIAAFRTTGEKQVFYQETFGPAVMEACGRGFVNPAPQAIPSLDAFLAGNSETFECRAVPASVATIAVTPMQDVSRYLLAASAVCFRMFGVRWPALDWLAAGLFAVTAVLFYTALRLVAGPILSASLTVLTILSPLQLANLPHIRDYSKAPFFVAAAAGLVWIMAPRRPRAIFIAAFGLGALMGVGLGFRTDVMLYVPPFVAGLLVCTPDGSSSPWRVRAGACALCLAACIALSWPILRVYSSGQSLWHVALLGLTTPFDRVLGVQPSLYEFGDQYRDTYVNVVSRSYWWRVHHAPVVDEVAYAAATGEYYRRLFAEFPADFVTRAWAAVLKSLDLPVNLNVARVVPYGITAGWLNKLFWYRWWLLSWFEGLALPLLAALAIGLSAAGRWIAALFLVTFIAFSAGITSLQFQPRHFFHLEMLDYWIFAAFVGWLMAVVSRWRGRSSPESARAIRMRPVMIFAVALVAMVVMPIAVLRAYQSRGVSALLTGYESAPVWPVDIREQTSKGIVRLGIALEAPPVLPSAQMLVTTLDAGMCGGGVDLTVRYEGDPYGQRDFTRSIRLVPQALAGGTTAVFLPVYDSIDVVGRVTFVGLEVPEGQRHCIRSVARLSDAGQFPLLLTTVLPAGWRAQPLYERIDPVETHPSMITPLVGKVWYRTRRLLRL